MGIYVPFLKKMPSRCEFCPIIDGTGCRARNPYYMDETGITRPKNCPLIKLPPHGRLIDADALENKGYNLVRYVYRDGYTALQQVALSAAPTILEAEVEDA